MAKPINPARGKPTTRTTAKERVKTQRAAQLRRVKLGQYREYFDKGMDPGTMADVINRTNATLLRIDILSAPKPPRVVLPKRKGKQLSKLDDKMANEICTQLQRGATLTLVASWVGITPHILSAWLKTKGEPYETFQNAVRQSLAFAEMNAINALRVGGYFDGKSAESFLKLRYPSKYNPNPTPPGVNLSFDLGSFLQEAWKDRKDKLKQRIDRVLAADEGRTALPSGDVVDAEVVSVPAKASKA